MNQMKKLSIAELERVIGGGGIDLTGLASIFGPTYTPWEALEIMNGVNRPTPHSCSPYGTGGTPNSYS